MTIVRMSDLNENARAAYIAPAKLSIIYGAASVKISVDQLFPARWRGLNASVYRQRAWSSLVTLFINKRYSKSKVKESV